MRVAIMAAGGLGGYFGGLLAQLGHEVTFIARGTSLKALKEQGVDWVIFAVKTYDTLAAAQAIRPIVGPETSVFTFQNGVEAHEEIGRVVGFDHVLVAPTQIVSNVVAPGVIEQKSPFRIVSVGEIGGKGLTPRVQQFVAELRRAEVEATAVPDGLVPLWHKFVFIASTSGMATLARTAPFDLFQMPEARCALHEAMEEVYRVGQALEIRMDSDIVERQYQFTLKLGPGQKPSMQLDLEQGKPLEIEALSGAVTRLGATKNIPTPVHQTIYSGLKPVSDRAGK